MYVLKHVNPTRFMKKPAFIALFSLIFSTTAFAAPPLPPPTILAGSVFTDNVTETSATVHFKTEPASHGGVNYCISEDPVSCVFVNGPVAEVNNHSITISGLFQNTRYYYQALASYGESPVAYGRPVGTPIRDWYTFTTLADTRAPVISNVRASASGTTAQIEWETNENASSGALYCPNPAPAGVECYEYSEMDGDFVRFHIIHLVGLTPGTRYFYNPHSFDVTGNEAWYRAPGDPGWPLFTTSGAVPAVAPAPGDISAPLIQNVKVTSITDHNAVINWQTRNADGSADESDGFVEYCRSAGLATCATVSRAVYEETHSLLTGTLLADTRYYFEIRSLDRAGNLSVYPTAGTPILERPNFLTVEAPAVAGAGAGVGVGGGGDRTPPIISNIQVDVDTNVSIVWGTNENSTSIVDFATDADFLRTGAYTLSAGSGTLVIFHHIILTPTILQPNTLYRFRVRSADMFNNMASSADRTFRTKIVAEPAISGGSTTSGNTPSSRTSQAGTGTRIPSVTSPNTSEGDGKTIGVGSEVKPFNNNVFQAETAKQGFSVQALLFVIFGIALMYLLSERESKSPEGF